MTDSEKLDLLISQMGEVKSDVSGLKEDVSGLKEDVSGLKEDVSGLKKDVSEIREDVSGLKKDVSEIREDVSGLKKDVSEIREDVSGLKKDVSELKDGQQKIWLHLENQTDKSLRILVENHIDLIRKLNENNKVMNVDWFYQFKFDYLEEDVKRIKEKLCMI